MNPSTEQILQFLIRARWRLLALAAVLGALAWVPSRQVAFDRSLENMFAESDPLLAPYRKLKRLFGGNELALLVYRDENLFDRDGAGIRRLARISQQVERVPGVKGVLSIDRIMGEDIVDPESRLALEQRKLFENLTHSRDGTIAAVVAMLIPEDETGVPRRETIEGLRAIAETLPSGMVAGEPVMVSDGFHYVEEDGRRLGRWSTVLLAAVLVLCFRSLRWVLIPVAVVQLALLLTRAVLVVSGLRLSMVSSMLTAIVTVIGIATVVHVIVRFREQRDAGLSPREALLACGLILAAPIFWSCLTDAAGFGSLRAARVGPVQDFGVMMAIGALMVLVAAGLLVPGLALAGKRDVDPGRVWGERAFARRLQGVAQAASHRPYAVGVPLLAVTALAIAGAVRLEVESDFTKNFRAGSPIVQSYEFVESNLGGAGVWDILIPVEDGLSWEYLQRVLRLEERLRNEVVLPGANGESTPALTKVVSLADAVQAANAASPVSLERLPSLVRKRVIAVALNEMEGRMPVFYGALYSSEPGGEGRYLRIMLRAWERQSSQQKRRIIAQVEKIASEEFPRAEVTGFFVLLTHLIDSIIPRPVADVRLRHGGHLPDDGRRIPQPDAGAGLAGAQRAADSDGDGGNGLAGRLRLQDQHGGGDDRGGLDRPVDRQLDPLRPFVPPRPRGWQVEEGGACPNSAERGSGGFVRHAGPGGGLCRAGRQPVCPHRLLRRAGEPRHVRGPLGEPGDVANSTDARHPGMTAATSAKRLPVPAVAEEAGPEVIEVVAESVPQIAPSVEEALDAVLPGMVADAMLEVLRDPLAQRGVIGSDRGEQIGQPPSQGAAVPFDRVQKTSQSVAEVVAALVNRVDQVLKLLAEGKFAAFEPFQEFPNPIGQRLLAVVQGVEKIPHSVENRRLTVVQGRQQIVQMLLETVMVLPQDVEQLVNPARKFGMASGQAIQDLLEPVGKLLVPLADPLDDLFEPLADRFAVGDRADHVPQMVPQRVKAAAEGVFQSLQVVPQIAVFSEAVEQAAEMLPQRRVFVPEFVGEVPDQLPQRRAVIHCLLNQFRHPVQHRRLQSAFLQVHSNAVDHLQKVLHGRPPVAVHVHQTARGVEHAGEQLRRRQDPRAVRAKVFHHVVDVHRGKPAVVVHIGGHKWVLEHRQPVGGQQTTVLEQFGRQPPALSLGEKK
jgi:uncharacterized protein